ncbi:PIN domain-containing protein [Candidatus Woesearchaeota archaeon]|nr:PIN domain-containing protein [Candidatus Woesearchaeota archaeon]
MTHYFYDSYALVEIARDTLPYQPYQQGTFVLCIFNLYEFYHSLFRHEPQLAESFFDRLWEACVEITPDDIKEAAQFRLKHHKERFSYADALGYILARRRGLTFLTGDKAFEGLTGVEFVK